MARIERKNQKFRVIKREIFVIQKKYKFNKGIFRKEKNNNTI